MGHGYSFISLERFYIIYAMLLAHLGDTEEGVVNTASDIVVESATLPVIGTFQTALIGLILILIFLGVVYFFMGRIPRIKRISITPEKEVVLAKVIAASILGAILAAGWDIWWHRAVGRDSLWQEPHLFLYSFALAAILLSVYGWIATHKKVWKRVASVLVLIPATAPFDNLWHIMFGVEDLSNPVSLAWSPPHMLLDIGGLLALIFLIPIILKDRKDVRRTFFLDIVFATVLAQIMFLVLPFHPTEGWGQVLGFWGAGFMSFVFISLLIYAPKLLKNSFDATRIMIYYLIILFVGYGEETAPNIILLPHDRAPLWLVIFPYLLAAIFLDLTAGKIPDWLRGIGAAGIWASLLFFVTPSFTEPDFTYPLVNGVYAVISACIGGIIAAFFVKKFLKTKF